MIEEIFVDLKVITWQHKVEEEVEFAGERWNCIETFWRRTQRRQVTIDPGPIEEVVPVPAFGLPYDAVLIVEDRGQVD